MLVDFFTVTEMKEGISTVERVEELVSKIKELSNSVDGEVADSIRQWSSAANALAATDDADCLQKFVQLDGISLLNHWLHVAVSCKEDANDIVIQDFVEVILTSLGRLPMDNEQFTGSGIKDTVKQLITLANFNINQKATILSEKWGAVNNSGSNYQQMETGRTSETDQLENPQEIQASENVQVVQATAAECPEAKSNSSIANNSVEVRACNTSDNEIVHMSDQQGQRASSDSTHGNAALGDVNSSVSSLISQGGLENQSVREESSWSTPVLASTGISHSKLNEGKSDDQHTELMKVAVETKSAGVAKSEDLLTDREANVEGQMSCNLDTKNRESDKLEPQVEPGFVSRVAKSLQAGGDVNQPIDVTCCNQDSSKGISILREESPIALPLTRKISLFRDMKGIHRDMNSKATKRVGGLSLSGSSKTTDARATVLTGEKSNLFTEYDDTDALEVARLVAIQVEREVRDYRLPFCRSSPEVHSDGGGDAPSPGLEIHQQSEPAIEEINGSKSPDAGDDSGTISSLKDDGSEITDESGSFGGKHGQDSNLANSAQELDSKSARNPSGLDLNANDCTREDDCFMRPDPSLSHNLSTPIHVAASRGVSAFPVTPLRFEGELGWKGSAATSAFRPASRRWTPDIEKSSAAQMEKAACVGFDLNIAESEDNDVAELEATEIRSTPLSLPYGDSPAVIGSSKAEKLDLDLNSPCEESLASNASLFWNRQPHTMDNSQHTASSPSSRQPALRNFDLNDDSSILDGGSSHAMNESSLKISGTYKEAVPEHPAITIMGSRVMLESKDQHRARNHVEHSFLSTRRNMESSAPARSVPYSHLPLPANGVIGYPTGSGAMPFPATFYGPGNVPYMVDFKGESSAPPMMGLGFNSAQPSFASASSIPSSNEVAYFQPSLDINYGAVPMEVGQREGGYFRPMFMQGHTVLFDEHARMVSQGSAPGRLLKRKEPDSSWDPYSRR